MQNVHSSERARCTMHFQYINTRDKRHEPHTGQVHSAMAIFNVWYVFVATMIIAHACILHICTICTGMYCWKLNFDTLSNAAARDVLGVWRKKRLIPTKRQYPWILKYLPANRLVLELISRAIPYIYKINDEKRDPCVILNLFFSVCCCFFCFCCCCCCILFSVRFWYLCFFLYLCVNGVDARERACAYLYWTFPVRLWEPKAGASRFSTDLLCVFFFSDYITSLLISLDVYLFLLSSLLSTLSPCSTLLYNPRCVWIIAFSTYALFCVYYYFFLLLFKWLLPLLVENVLITPMQCREERQ